jgi:hypothetical protein
MRDISWVPEASDGLRRIGCSGYHARDFRVPSNREFHCEPSVNAEMTKTSPSREGTHGMNNDEIEPVRSAVPAIAAAIIDSFVITHSIIITVIVAVSALAALSPGKGIRRRSGDRKRS